jgi:hypothetical protein
MVRTALSEALLPAGRVAESSALAARFLMCKNPRLQVTGKPLRNY